MLALALAACATGGLFGKPKEKVNPTTVQALQGAVADPAIIAATSPPLPAVATECPPIRVRPGGETLFSYVRGKTGSAQNLGFQAVIDRQTRNCVASNGLITVNMGVAGRFLLGPAGNPGAVDLPVRFVIERDGAALFSEKYAVPVAPVPPAQSADFVKVIENVAVPYVAGDEIVIWVGFDSGRG